MGDCSCQNAKSYLWVNPMFDDRDMVILTRIAEALEKAIANQTNLAALLKRLVEASERAYPKV